jgi:hypothetical protein
MNNSIHTAQGFMPPFLSSTILLLDASIHRSSALRLSLAHFVCSRALLFFGLGEIQVALIVSGLALVTGSAIAVVVVPILRSRSSCSFSFSFRALSGMPFRIAPCLLLVLCISCFLFRITNSRPSALTGWRLPRLTSRLVQVLSRGALMASGRGARGAVVVYALRFVIAAC